MKKKKVIYSSFKKWIPTPPDFDSAYNIYKKEYNICTIYIR